MRACFFVYGQPAPHDLRAGTRARYGPANGSRSLASRPSAWLAPACCGGAAANHGGNGINPDCADSSLSVVLKHPPLASRPREPAHSESSTPSIRRRAGAALRIEPEEIAIMLKLARRSLAAAERAVSCCGAMLATGVCKPQCIIGDAAPSSMIHSASNVTLRCAVAAVAMHDR